MKATGGLVPDSVENAAPSLAAQRVAPALAPPRRRPKPRLRTDLKLNLRERCLFYLMVAVMHLVSLLPDAVLYGLGALGGRLAFRLDKRHVRIGLRNLEIAFPELGPAGRLGILQDSYVNLGRSAAEYIRLGGFFYRRLMRKVRYEGIELWEDIARRYPGRGVLLLTAHLGNFEVGPAVHVMHGHQMSLVHHTQRFLPGDALMTFVRERAGIEIIRKHSAARAVLRALQRGEMVATPFDQNAKRSEALFVPFFGELAATSSGLARIARISGAVVLPVFTVRDPNRRTHRILIQGELPLQRTADADADIMENTRRLVAVIERMARTYPDQFLWTHRRYRTRPRGAPKIYD
ncbi:MAG TPA: lysophospholipid acyltransferase family protein [Candidatus Binataceae bacterium]